MTDTENENEIFILSFKLFNLTTMNQIKNQYFEYIVYLLNDWLVNSNLNMTGVFTKLRLQKLLFLVSTIGVSKKENGLLDYFDNFYALPYGPVEIDIYASMNKNRFQHIKFYGNLCKASNLDANIFKGLDPVFKSKAKTSVDLLKAKGRNYLSMPIFDLVSLTHQWTVWRNSFAVARMLGSKSAPMRAEDIRSSKIKAF